MSVQSHDFENTIEDCGVRALPLQGNRRRRSGMDWQDCSAGYSVIFVRDAGDAGMGACRISYSVKGFIYVEPERNKYLEMTNLSVVKYLVEEIMETRLPEENKGEDIKL
jgi:hypothetical protein